MNRRMNDDVVLGVDPERSIGEPAYQRGPIWSGQDVRDRVFFPHLPLVAVAGQEMNIVITQDASDGVPLGQTPPENLGRIGASIDQISREDQAIARWIEIELGDEPNQGLEGALKITDHPRRHVTLPHPSQR
jgi:hypothetical protein